MNVTSENQNALAAYLRKYKGINIIVADEQIGNKTIYRAYFKRPREQDDTPDIMQDENGNAYRQDFWLFQTIADNYEQAQRRAIEEAIKITKLNIGII